MAQATCMRAGSIWDQCNGGVRTDYYCITNRVTLKNPRVDRVPIVTDVDVLDNNFVLQYSGDGAAEASTAGRGGREAGCGLRSIFPGRV